MEAPYKILIMCDKVDFISCVKKLSKETNCLITIAEEFDYALKIINSEKQDILFVDIDLPNNGFERILNSGNKVSVTSDIILISTLESRSNAGQYIDKGISDFLIKPVNYEILKFTVQKAIERKELLLAREKMDLLKKLSLVDNLTGIYNRRYFSNHLDYEINHAKMKGTPLTILMIDIDDFKTINDTYGNLVGDSALSWVSNNLKKLCRTYDTVARFGGEEFSVILPDTHLKNAENVAQRIINLFSTTVFPEIEKVITVSIGISYFPKHSQTKKDLIRKADSALYYSKYLGKNIFTVYSPQFENVQYKSITLN